jgi:hypothetical protein
MAERTEVLPGNESIDLEASISIRESKKLPINEQPFSSAQFRKILRMPTSSYEQNLLERNQGFASGKCR